MLKKYLVNHKSLFSLVLVGIMWFNLCGSISQVRAEDVIQVKIDGEIKKFEQTPILINGRTMVPMRAIFEALGARVQWDGETKSITAVKNIDTIKLQIDNTYARKNGTKIVLDVAPQIIDNVTMVPLRFVGEALGAYVDWDGNKKVVNILSMGTEGKLPILSVEGSSADVIEHSTLNGNEETDGVRWYGQTGQWVVYDLGEVKNLGGVGISFYKSSERIATFEIEVSNDKQTWTKVAKTKSSGNATKEEMFKIPDTMVRFVKIVFQGTSSTPWTGISNVSLYDAEILATPKEIDPKKAKLVDNMDDLKKAISSNNLKAGSSGDGKTTNGDKSLATRLNEKEGEVVYYVEKMRIFQLDVFYHSALLPGSVKVYVSRDNSTWTPVELKMGSSVETSAGWNGLQITSALRLPVGSQYIKVELSGGTSARQWTPIISRFMVD